MLIIPNSFNIKLNISLARGFVKILANCISVPMNFISQFPLAICSRRK